MRVLDTEDDVSPGHSVRAHSCLYSVQHFRVCGARGTNVNSEPKRVRFVCLPTEPPAKFRYSALNCTKPLPSTYCSIHQPLSTSQSALYNPLRVTYAAVTQTTKIMNCVSSLGKWNSHTQTFMISCMSGVSLCLHFLSIFCTHIPSPPCMLHEQQVPTAFIPSTQRYLAKHARCAEPHYATCPFLLSIVVLFVHINSNIRAVVCLEFVLIFTFHLFSCLSAAYLETTTL